MVMLFVFTLLTSLKLALSRWTDFNRDFLFRTNRKQAIELEKAITEAVKDIERLNQEVWVICMSDKSEW